MYMMCHAHLSTEIGGASPLIGGCGLFNVEDVELNQLPVVTEGGEAMTPENTVRNVRN